MKSYRSQREKGMVSRREGNQFERGGGDKMSLLEKAVMDLWMKRCRAISRSSLGMLEVDGVRKVKMVTAARYLYPVVRGRSWTMRNE